MNPEQKWSLCQSQRCGRALPTSCIAPGCLLVGRSDSRPRVGTWLFKPLPKARGSWSSPLQERRALEVAPPDPPCAALHVRRNRRGRMQRRSEHAPTSSMSGCGGDPAPLTAGARAKRAAPPMRDARRQQRKRQEGAMAALGRGAEQARARRRNSKAGPSGTTTSARRWGRARLAG